jgi:hypothetical protein
MTEIEHLSCIKDRINAHLNVFKTNMISLRRRLSVTQGFKWFLNANENAGANGETEELAQAQADRKVMTTMNAQYIFWNNKKINPQPRSDSFCQEALSRRLQRP